MGDPANVIGSVKKANRDKRAARRKAQILAATRACVRDLGFHAASMNRIAGVAGMSVGHIYQYFENKDAIMLALCESDTEEFLLHMAQLQKVSGTDIDSIVEAFLEQVPWLMDNDRASLTIEAMAEAGRNEIFSGLIKQVDAMFADTIREMAWPVLKALSEAEIEMRVQTILMMTRGLMLHAGTHRDSDHRTISAGFAFALRGLLSVPQQEH